MASAPIWQAGITSEINNFPVDRGSLEMGAVGNIEARGRATGGGAAGAGGDDNALGADNRYGSEFG